MLRLLITWFWNTTGQSGPCQGRLGAVSTFGLAVEVKVIQVHSSLEWYWLKVDGVRSLLFVSGFLRENGSRSFGCSGFGLDVEVKVIQVSLLLMVRFQGRPPNSLQLEGVEKEINEANERRER